MLSISCNSCIKSSKIQAHSERITKMRSFINKYNWQGINFPSEKYDWKKFEKNNPTLVLKVFYAKKGNIYPAYVSKHNSNREKQFIFSMNPNGEGWHYLKVKKLLALLRGITSKHHGDFCCLNCFYSFATEKKINLVKKYVKIKIFVTFSCLLKTINH